MVGATPRRLDDPAHICPPRRREAAIPPVSRTRQALAISPPAAWLRGRPTRLELFQYRGSGPHDVQFDHEMWMAGEDPALDRRGHHPAAARARLVDDAYDAAARPARQLRRALRARLRPAGAHPPPALVAMAQSGTG